MKTRQVKYTKHYTFSYEDPIYCDVYIQFMKTGTNNFRYVEFTDNTFTDIIDIEVYTSEEELIEVFEAFFEFKIKFIEPDEINIREAKVLELIEHIGDSIEALRPRYSKRFYKDSDDRLEVVNETEAKLKGIVELVDYLHKF